MPLYNPITDLIPAPHAATHEAGGTDVVDADTVDGLHANPGAVVGVPTYIGKAIPLALTGQGNVAYTDLDLTAYTSPSARAVFGNLQCLNTTSGEFGRMNLRYNGSTNDYEAIIISPDELSTIALCAGFVLNMDAGQIIEYQIVTEASPTVRVAIVLNGYW